MRGFPGDTGDLLNDAERFAIGKAFSHVRKKLHTASDLENLAQIKQSAYTTHQEKISCLKARVQALVSNIEKGIDDLDLSAYELNELMHDIKHIESESVTVTHGVTSQHSHDLHCLSTIWERIVEVDSMITEFQKADNVIASINEFFKQNPNGFSIKCFNAIQEMLAFRERLRGAVRDPDMRQFIEEKFAGVEENKKKLLDNVDNALVNIFSSEQIDTDAMIRANWILSATGHQGMIMENLKAAIRSNFQSDIYANLSQESLAMNIKKLNEKVECLPEQMESLIPALPDGAKIMGDISDIVMNQIVIVIQGIANTVENTSFLIVSLVSAMNEIACTMRAMMGVSPNADYKLLKKELEDRALESMRKDLDAVLTKIVNIDEKSIQSKKGQILVTPAPADLIKSVESMDSFIMTSGLPDKEMLLGAMRESYIMLLKSKLETILNAAHLTWNKEYAMALMNNSFDANSVINDFMKRRDDLINAAQAKEMKQIWLKIQIAAMSSLVERIYSDINMEEDGDLDFTVGLYDKLMAFNAELGNIKPKLIEPIFRKVQGSSCRFLLSKIMISYKEKKSGEKMKDFEDRIASDIQWFRDFCYEMQFITCDRFAEMAETYRAFMTEPLEEMYQTFPILAKEYTDLTGEVGLKLLMGRPDLSVFKKEEVKEQMSTLRNGVHTNPDDQLLERCIGIERKSKK